MIDLRLLREDPDLVRASQTARGDDPHLVDQVLDADARRRSALTEFETLRAEQKSLGKQVAQAQGDEKQALLTRGKHLAEQVKALQADADAAETLATELSRKISNVVEDGVPAGGEDDYVVLKHVGEGATSPPSTVRLRRCATTSSWARVSRPSTPSAAPRCPARGSTT